jgi:adenylate kinase
MGLALDRAVELTVDTDEVVARLLKRAQEQGRADDTEDVIRRRMEVYTEQTEPLTRVYADAGILVRVDGMGSVDEVRDRVLAVL